jgi:hypothetical protein
MIDRRIARDLEARWPEEFQRTSSHSFRTNDDMPYPMAYAYFMMHQVPLTRHDTRHTRHDTRHTTHMAETTMCVVISFWRWRNRT